MKNFLIQNPKGFDYGYTGITKIGDELETYINFGILKLKPKEVYDLNSIYESALLLIYGHAEFYFLDNKFSYKRNDFFTENPCVLHISNNINAKIIAFSDCEFALFQTPNSNIFSPQFFTEKNMADCEHRSKDILDNTSYRIVRTIFDHRNRPESNLVLGEVINLPGRWSSYPPHHHEQPEIYHYRFSEVQGYGHGELGENVYKIKHNDTLKILYEQDHAQVSAPGYKMMYVWAIRHLPNNPYIAPVFNPIHEKFRYSS